MGQFYDNQKTTWRSYVAIISICISFVMYKHVKKYLSSVNDGVEVDQHLLLNDVEQQPDNDERNIQNDAVQSPKKKKTVFQRLWIQSSKFSSLMYKLIHITILSISHQHDNV